MAKRTEQAAVTTARARLATERGGVRKDWGGRLPFALVYPNSYQIGMSNLGLQVIYRLLNAKPERRLRARLLRPARARRDPRTRRHD